MIETGRVIEIIDNKVKVMIRRHEACGDCKACHVSKNQLEMLLTADNEVGAKVGDEVELNIESIDFMSAVLIMYGIPLLALILGIFGGYYLFAALGVSSQAAQGLGALSGLIIMALSYLLIKSKEKSITSMKKYKPVITSIRKNNN